MPSVLCAASVIESVGQMVCEDLYVKTILKILGRAQIEPQSVVEINNVASIINGHHIVDSVIPQQYIVIKSTQPVTNPGVIKEYREIWNWARASSHYSATLTEKFRFPVQISMSD